MTNAPPLGVTPVKIWDKQQEQNAVDAKRERAIHLAEAILRYLEAKKPVPPEWGYELRDLILGVRHGEN